ncbi:MAG TPA: hypothetical protein VHA53_10105 [Nitrolancea sp.]|nr:hypothetical protein [Nitrolancea sp.]
MTRRVPICWGCVLLLAGLLLSACGTPDTTPGAGFAFASSTATPEVVIDVATPSATAPPAPTPTAAATPDGTPPPMSMIAYLQAFSRIAEREVDITRGDLTLIASGADDPAIADQLRKELPERQQLFDDLKKLNPPNELKTLEANAVTSEQQDLDAQQQLIQGVQTGDQSLIDGATQTILNGQLMQSYCSSGSAQEMMQNQLGVPIGTPSAADLAAIPQDFRDYNNQLLPVINDMGSQYRTLCPLFSTVTSDKSSTVTQLKQILPSLSKDVDTLSQITPPDAFSEYHQDLVAGYQKLVESEQLGVQAFEQNDESIKIQARVAQAQGQLKLLDAQDALNSALMNEMTGP